MLGLPQERDEVLMFTTINKDIIMVRKHRILLNNTIEFNILVDGERKSRRWKKGKTLRAAVRSRTVERTVDGEVRGFEVADIAVFSKGKLAVVLPEVPCGFFSFLDEIDAGSEVVGDC
jgi:hypothetical protein